MCARMLTKKGSLFITVTVVRKLNGSERRNRVTFVEWNHESEFLEEVCGKKELSSLSGMLRETVFARSEIHVIVHCSPSIDQAEQTEKWLMFGEKFDFETSVNSQVE
jgi:hypothetical protein